MLRSYVVKLKSYVVMLRSYVVILRGYEGREWATENKLAMQQMCKNIIFFFILSALVTTTNVYKQP